MNAKYLLDMPGHGPWSVRLRLLLLSGAVIFQSSRGTEAAQFFDPLLKPLLVPFITAQDLQEKVQWLRQNDHVASRMAKAGHLFAWHCLTPEAVQMYLVVFLRRLASLAGPSSETQKEQPADQRSVRADQGGEEACDTSERRRISAFRWRRALEECTHL